MSNFKRYYQNNNIVFVTIVTYDRRPILIENISLLRNSLANLNYNYKIIAGIVLPDHLHLLIQVEDAKEFSKLIASFKASFSKHLPLNKNQTEKQLERREKGIWQRKYYDHIIKNEQDFNKHLDYIHYNPMKHFNITPQNWKYSSFRKFVKLGFYEENWCNIEDRHKINTLNLE